MISKKALLLAILVTVSSSLFAVDKWNIQLANILDLSRVKDKNTGLTIQKSIASQLAKQNGFNLVQSRTNITIDNFQEALYAGRAYHSDVILYGDYYIEGEDLVIVIDVFDVLENRLKMRKYYSGKVDLDIFDTIDSMSADMVKKIKEALPELTAESQVKIKQVRQNLYESEKISIKRMFYARFGLLSEFGPKQYWRWGSPGNGGGFPNGSGANNLGFSGMAVGFAFRFWELRFDLLGSGITGLPAFAWQYGSYQWGQNNKTPVGMFSVQLSFYLPWFNNSLAIGAGIQTYDVMSSIFVDTNKMNVNWNGLSGSSGNSGVTGMGFPLFIGIIWNPNPNMEFSLTVDPFLYFSQSAPQWDDKNVFQGTNTSWLKRDFPAMSLDGIVFFGNLGLELRLAADSFHYAEAVIVDPSTTNYSASLQGNNGPLTVNSTYVSAYLGVVYRLDFMQ